MRGNPEWRSGTIQERQFIWWKVDEFILDIEEAVSSFKINWKCRD
jgi:hypothetical protein